MVQLLKTQFLNETFESKSVIELFVRTNGAGPDGSIVKVCGEVLPYVGITDCAALMKRFAFVTFPWRES